MIWTAEQDELLKANYWQGDLDVLCQQLGEVVWRVRARASKLGVRRDPTLAKKTWQQQTARDIAGRR